MNRNQSITIPASLVSEFETWGKTTAKLFGKLRRQTGLKAAATQDKLKIPELKRPKQIPKNQAWFWSEDWQRGEREVNEALKRGEYTDFESVDDLIKDLHTHVLKSELQNHSKNIMLNYIQSSVKKLTV